MSDQAPSSSDGSLKRQRCQSLVQLEWLLEIRDRLGFASNFTPSSPNPPISTALALPNHGKPDNNALESTWIQRLKKPAAVSSPRRLSLTAVEHRYGGGGGDEPVRAIADCVAGRRFFEGLELRAGGSRPTPSSEGCKEGLPDVPTWGHLGKCSKEVALSRACSYRVSEETCQMQKSQVGMTVRRVDMHPHASDNSSQQSIKDKTNWRLELHQGSALSSTNNGLGNLHKETSKSSKGFKTLRDENYLHGQACKEDVDICREKCMYSIRVHEGAEGNPHRSLWYWQTGGHMRVMVSQADQLDKLPLLPENPKERIISTVNSFKLKPKELASKPENPTIGLCSPTIAGFGPLRASIRKPAIPPGNPLLGTVPIYSFAHSSLNAFTRGTFVDASEPAEKKFSWVLSRHSPYVSTAGAEERNARKKAGSKVVHSEDVEQHSLAEKGLVNISAFDSRKLEMKIWNLSEQPLSSHPSRENWQSPVAMSGRALQDPTWRRNMSSSAIASGFNKTSAHGNPGVDSAARALKEHARKHSASQIEVNESNGSILLRMDNWVSNYPTESSLTPADVLDDTEVVHGCTSCTSTARYPCEHQKSNSYRYPVICFNVNDSMPNSEVNGQKRYQSKFRLDLNHSLHNSREEDRISLEDTQSVKSFPVCQQTNVWKFPCNEPNENESRKLIMLNGHTCTSTGGIQHEVEGNVHKSHFSWLQRWFSPYRNSTFGLSEPIDESKNATNNTFGSQHKNFDPLYLEQNELYVRRGTCPSGPSTQERMDVYKASSSRGYISSSVAALALTSKVTKQGPFSYSRSKGSLEVFRSSPFQRPSFDSKSTHRAFTNSLTRSLLDNKSPLKALVDSRAINYDVKIGHSNSSL